MKLKNIQILRAIAIVSIVIGHSLALHTGAWSFVYRIKPILFFKIVGYIFSSYFLWLYVFISGYLFAYSSDNKKGITFQSFLLKKTERLLMPYFIWGTLYYLVFNNSRNYSIEGYLVQITSGIGHLWFLLMLFWVFIFYFFMSTIGRNVPYKIVFFLLLFIGGVFLLKQEFNLLQLSSALKYLIGFHLGYIIWENDETIKRYFTIKHITISMTVFATLFVAKLIGAYALRSRLSADESCVSLIYLYGEFVGLPLGITGSLLLFLVVNYYLNLQPDKSVRWLDYIEQNSFGIYIFHQFYMLLFLKAISSYIDVLPVIVPVVLIVIGLGCSLISCYVFNKITILKRLIT